MSTGKHGKGEFYESSKGYRMVAMSDKGRKVENSVKCSKYLRRDCLPSGIKAIDGSVRL